MPLGNKFFEQPGGKVETPEIAELKDSVRNLGEWASEDDIVRWQNRAVNLYNGSTEKDIDAVLEKIEQEKKTEKQQATNWKGK